MRAGIRVRFAIAFIVVFALASACENESDGGKTRETLVGVTSIDVAAGKASQVRSMVQTFMERRVEGRGVDTFLDADGREVFGPGGTLSPLYPKPPLQDFKLVFVDDLGDGTYEVGVRLIFDRGSYGETLFVHHDEAGFVVSGGRPGLQGP